MSEQRAQYIQEGPTATQAGQAEHGEQAQENHGTEPTSPFIKWIIDHDDSWFFVLSYLGLALVLTIMFSLFWLVVLVAIHAALEWIRQRHHDPRGPLSANALRTLWAVKLDMALVLLALALSVYMEVILGAVGIGQAARLGVQGGTRITIWARVMRGFVMSVDEAAQVARVSLTKGRKPKAEPALTEAPDPTLASHPWRHWGWEDHLACWLALLCVGSILVAPWFTTLSVLEIWQIMAQEMTPFPAAEVMAE